MRFVLFFFIMLTHFIFHIILVKKNPLLVGILAYFCTYNLGGEVYGADARQPMHLSSMFSLYVFVGIHVQGKLTV